MLLYCLKCKKKKKIQKVKVQKFQGQKRRKMILSKCAVCDNKKLKSTKEQKAGGLLSSLVIKTPLSKIPLISPLLF